MNMHDADNTERDSLRAQVEEIRKRCELAEKENGQLKSAIRAMLDDRPLANVYADKLLAALAAPNSKDAHGQT
jgi:hypothetical protein